VTPQRPSATARRKARSRYVCKLFPASSSRFSPCCKTLAVTPHRQRNVRDVLGTQPPVLLRNDEPSVLVVLVATHVRQQVILVKASDLCPPSHSLRRKALQAEAERRKSLLHFFIVLCSLFIASRSGKAPNPESMFTASLFEKRIWHSADKLENVVTQKEINTHCKHTFYKSLFGEIKNPKQTHTNRKHRRKMTPGHALQHTACTKQIIEGHSREALLQSRQP
jgi:hypothetical protein